MEQIRRRLGTKRRLVLYKSCEFICVIIFCQLMLLSSARQWDLLLEERGNSRSKKKSGMCEEISGCRETTKQED